MTRLIEQTAVLAICVIYFWVIGNEWYSMALSGYIICVLTTVISLIFPESPRMLLVQGKADEFKKAIDMLARWNGS